VIITSDVMLPAIHICRDESDIAQVNGKKADLQ